MTVTALPVEMLWNDTAAPLTVVNEGDLRLPKLLAQFGADRLCAVELLPTSDRDEILRRQAISAWLLDNEAVSSALREHSLLPDIPLGEHDFLMEFHRDHINGSRFMESLRSLYAAIDAAVNDDTPDVVRDFASVLGETIEDASALEIKFRDTTFEYVGRAACLSGTVDYVKLSKGDTYVLSNAAVVSGYRLHCYEPLGYRRWEFSEDRAEWAYHHPWMSAPVRAARWLWNRRFDRHVYGPQTIDRLPKEMVPVIERAGREVLAKDDGKGKVSWQLTFAFRYEDGELTIKLIDIHLDTEDSQGKVGLDVTDWERSKQLKHKLFTNFAGYSWLHKWRLERGSRKIAKRATGSGLCQVHRACVLANLPEGAGDYFSLEGKSADDASFKQRFGLHAVRGLCCEETDLPVKALYKGVLKYRVWAASRVAQLVDLSHVLGRMRTISVDGKLPFEFPQVLAEDEHLVKFDSLVPVHLIGQPVAERDPLSASDLRPIRDLSKLNGQIVFLTGHHAGGKTVTEESVAQAVWLAQCGLPVFGENVSFNPKEVLAAVFIERGAGSTAELLLSKLTAVLDVVITSDPARTLVIVDELGTGTQEVDGDDLARQILAKLRSVGCSVLCSTQIQSLARHAESDLGALMFNVSRDNRTIEPGIAAGDLSGLADHVGLSKYLH